MPGGPYRWGRLARAGLLDSMLLVGGRSCRRWGLRLKVWQLASGTGSRLARSGTTAGIRCTRINGSGPSTVVGGGTAHRLSGAAGVV